MLHLLAEDVDLVAHAPIHGLDLSPCLEVDDAMREEFQGLVADLLGVVPVLQHVARGDVVPNLVQVLHQLVVAVLCLKLLGHLGQRGGLQHVDDQHAVVGSQGAATLRDDVGMGKMVLVGRIDKGVDAVVDILLYGIVDRALAVA